MRGRMYEFLFINDITAPLLTTEMGKCWGGQGSNGVVPLNKLVGNNYNGQCTTLVLRNAKTE
jgi:hypothetical protein